MEAKFKDGGPAFPVECQWDGSDVWGVQTGNRTGWATGMTLRDYFAAKAMQAFAQGAQGMGDMDRAEVKRQFDSVCQFAYLMADAMLRARSATHD